MFPNLQTLVLYNVPGMSYNDFGPYLAMIPFLQHIKLESCSLTKASSLICSSLLGHNTTSRLQSCTLHSSTDIGVTFREPIPSSYQVQQSLIDLRIIMKDFISLKNLLQFLPKLSNLCKSTETNSNVFSQKFEIYVT
jgi:hypothetical protein